MVNRPDAPQFDPWSTGRLGIVSKGIFDDGEKWPEQAQYPWYRRPRSPDPRRDYDVPEG